MCANRGDFRSSRLQVLREVPAFRHLSARRLAKIDRLVDEVSVPAGHVLAREGTLNRNSLIAFRSACWYSWSEQTRSMEKLLDYDFEWVLPGHGRIHHDSREQMREHLARCIDWMKMR